MKAPEEIEKLAEKKYEKSAFSYAQVQPFIDGYKQCQEDNTEKKYTEEDLHTILKLRREWYSHTDKNVVRDFIKEINNK